MLLTDLANHIHENFFDGWLFLMHFMLMMLIFYQNRYLKAALFVIVLNKMLSKALPAVFTLILSFTRESLKELA